MKKLYFISIHALLAESDGVGQGRPTRSLYFYPRSPCGERHVFADEYHSGDTISIHALLAESDVVVLHIVSGAGKFLSTLSLRRATTHPVTVFVCIIISIHALLAESDHILDDMSGATGHFYPRSPCGERPFCRTISFSAGRISIHALLAESDSLTSFAG